jgi:hypothetical protein
VRDLKPSADVNAALEQLHNGPPEVRHAVDEDGLIAFKNPPQQHGRRISVKANHRHPRSQGLDRKDQLATETVREVADVLRNIAAWKVDKLQRPKHKKQASRAEKAA